MFFGSFIDNRIERIINLLLQYCPRHAYRRHVGRMLYIQPYICMYQWYSDNNFKIQKNQIMIPTEMQMTYGW